MRASICRTVLYYFRNRAGRLIVRPAIVTSLGHGDLVNLHVFFEPRDFTDSSDGMPINSKTCHRENVRYCDKDPETSILTEYDDAWSWPPRVG